MMSTREANELQADRTTDLQHERNKACYWLHVSLVIDYDNASTRINVYRDLQVSGNSKQYNTRN